MADRGSGGQGRRAPPVGAQPGGGVRPRARVRWRGDAAASPPQEDPPVRRTLPFAALGLAFAGCLYIPYHSAAPGSRLEPDDKSLDFLRRAPTREQVLLQLGEPDWVAKKQRVFVYTWKAEWG